VDQLSAPAVLRCACIPSGSQQTGWSGRRAPKFGLHRTGDSGLQSCNSKTRLGSVQ
jgi:hypothetical protein